MPGNARKCYAPIYARKSWRYPLALSTSLGFVETGLGISVLPRLATPRNGHPIIATRPLRSPALSRTIGIKRRNFSLSPPAQQFVDRLMQQGGNSDYATPGGAPA